MLRAIQTVIYRAFKGSEAPVQSEVAAGPVLAQLPRELRGARLLEAVLRGELRELRVALRQHRDHGLLDAGRQGLRLGLTQARLRLAAGERLRLGLKLRGARAELVHARLHHLRKVSE